MIRRLILLRRGCLILGFLVFAGAMLSSCERADYHTIDGDSGRFNEHRGQWLIINYWAIWCKPCLEEIPELNRFAESDPRTRAIFAVDFDGSEGATLQRNSEKMGITFPVLRADPAITLGYPRPTVLPTTVIINPQGKLHRTLIGPQTEQSLTQALTE